MLTPQQRAIVKSTVPLLESGGEALTTHFYNILLAEHAEVRPFFNQAHQASGDQPRALANGVLIIIERIEAEINKLNDFLSDSDMFTREPVKFRKASEGIAERQKALANAEAEWMALMEKDA